MSAVYLTDGKCEFPVEYRDRGQTQPGIYTTVFEVEGRSIVSEYADPLNERDPDKRLANDRLVLAAEGLFFAEPIRVIFGGQVVTL